MPHPPSSPEERTVPPLPVVLLTPDGPDDDAPAELPEYAVRTNYAEALVEAGATVLILPREPARIEAALALADGVVIGGTGPGVTAPAARIAFERALALRAMALGRPLLGICHGMQVIGACLGGRIATDLPGLAGAVTRHIPAPVPDRVAHDVTLDRDGQLYAWNGAARAGVNSFHRHALVGDGAFRVAARADDGIIEAIEGAGPGFCLGVQWHPEYRLTALDRRIWREFVARCAAGGEA